MTESIVNGPQSSIFSGSKNANFLNQELLFFIDNLHQKATKSGLKEDALIPMKTPKDKKIYESFRPQSAIGGRPQSALEKDGKKLQEKNNSPTNTVMRSSFYSISLMDDSNFENENDQEISRFK